MRTAASPSPVSASADRDPRWAAVAARDRRADGSFFYSVSTTGVYCRPSCAARRANPKHVRFHRTTADAERAGFRPCRRCQPDRPSLEQRYSGKVEAACRAIERSDTVPSLAALAEQAHLSPSHFHRVFRSLTGVTPRAYAVARRARRVRAELATTGKTVTDAIYDAGFGSGGRFYEVSDQMLGMTPTRFRHGGTDVEIRFAVGDCSLGAILVAQSARGVCAIFLGDDPDALLKQLEDRFPRATLLGGDAAFERTVAHVVGCVERPDQRFDLPLDVRGTAFQQRVWQALRRIPLGTTASYAQIAARIGAPASVRAVAQACGANPVAVVIPCHRVVRTDGSLSGYRWGVERKRRLLEREGVSIESAE